MRGSKSLICTRKGRRIGLAISDRTRTLARPLETIAVTSTDAVDRVAHKIAQLAAEEDGLSAVALGYPRRLSGEPSEQTAAVEAIAALLRRLVSVPVVLQDERLSSREAESLLARSEKDWRKRKPQLDAASAAVILQDYLDAQTRPASRHAESEDL